MARRKSTFGISLKKAISLSQSGGLRQSESEEPFLSHLPWHLRTMFNPKTGEPNICWWHWPELMARDFWYHINHK